MDEPLGQLHPEVESLLESCEQYAHNFEYLYFGKGQMFAEFIWNEPIFGYDFEAEINIYLKNHSIILVLFGVADPGEVQALAETYSLLAPHVVSQIVYSVDEDMSLYVIQGTNGHC